MSKKNKEPMSLSKKYSIRYTLDGAIWLLYAVLNLVPGGKLLNIFCAMILFIAVICSCVSLLAKADPEDEMSEHNMRRAKAMTLDIFISVFLIFGIITLLMGGYSMDIRKLYPFVVGVVQLLTGILFVLFERAGD